MRKDRPDPSRPTRRRTSVGARRNPFPNVVAVVQQNADRLMRIPGVLSVRPGYRFRDGWITREPAIVISVAEKRDPALLAARNRLPAEIGGVPVDVKPASPVEQLLARNRLSDAAVLLNTGLDSSAELALPGWELFQPPSLAVLAQEGGTEVKLALHPYNPPPGIRLAEIKGAMTVRCCLSPDTGFANLKQHFQSVKSRLTVAMYDFTAPHVLDSLAAALKKASGQFRLILDPKVALPSESQRDTSNKGDDLREEVVTERLSHVLGNRFKFVWAAVTSRDKVTSGIFPTAYHIKVAVADGRRTWLSSGNWQSSNQPDLEALDLDLPTLQRRFNREWHVIVDSPELSRVFEQFIEWDMQQARPLQGGADPLSLPDFLVPEAPPEEAAALASARSFPAQDFTFTQAHPVRVRPLLTPDNFAEQVLKVVRSARRTLYFQNQYIKIGKKNEPKFTRLLDVLCRKIEDGVDVRIVLRDESGDTREMLEALQYYGFDASRIKLQRGCHTKGIIVDSETVVVGSHNWSNQGVLRNRDASLIFYDPDIARYYQQAFLYDWNHLARQRLSTELAMPRVAGTEPQFVRVTAAAY